MLLAIFVALALVVLALIQSCAPLYDPPNGAQGRERPPGSAYESDKPGDNGEGCERGAPVWHFDFKSLNLVVYDTPIWVDSAYGPNIEFSLTYNALGKENPQSSVGSRWTHSYGDYITTHEETGSFILFSGDGRVDEYEKIGTNFVLNKYSLMAGEASFLPRLTVQGEQIKAQYVDGSYKLFEASDEGKYALVTSVDQSGNALTFTYQNKKLTQITNALAQSVTLTYNQNNQITTATGPTGYQAHFEYNDKGELISLEDMQGYIAKVGYDENGIINSLKDAKGETQFIVEFGDPDSSRVDEYPALGDPMGMSSRITAINPLGYREEFFYNSQTGKSWHVSPENYVNYVDRHTNNAQDNVPKTVYQYQRFNKGYSRISQIDYPDNTWVRFEYDDNRNLSKKSYSDGSTIQFRNNSLGSIIQSIDTLGNETIYVYDDNQNLIKEVTPRGDIRYSYNSSNLLTNKTDLNGAQTQYQYNDKGQLIQVIGANKQVVNLSYSEGLLGSISTSDKVIASYQYDALGRVTQVTDLHGKATQYQYDRINQLTHVKQAGNRNSEIVYGSCPRILESKTLPGDRTYQYQYNSAKQLMAVVDPMAGVTRLERDAAGRIAAIIDANQNKTEFEYNEVGQLTTKRYADGNEFNIAYEQGYIKQTTNARGITKSFTYNEKNQLVRVSYSDDTPGVSYQYNAFGQIESVTDSQGKTQYTYHANGMPNTIDGPWNKDTIAINFDELNRVSSIQLNEENYGEYKYDALSRLKQISALEQVFDLTYNDTADDVSASLTYPNDVVQTLSFDSVGDISQLQYKRGDSKIAEFTFGFDVAGNITQLQTSESLPFEPVQPKASYNVLNQIKSWNGNTDVFAYDADGNLIRGLLPDNIPFTADYDAENRLVSIQFEKEGRSIEERFEYGYDHFLRVYQRFENSSKVVEKRFVRLGLIELEERDAQDNTLAKNIWRPDRPGGVGGLLMRQQNSQNYYYLTNHLGHVYGVVDQQGQRLSQRAYSPYGQVTGDDFSLQPFGMSTKRSDFESGLAYFGYRFYMPNLGRWLNRDPLQEQGGINLYAYVNGDPLRYIDPDGRSIFAGGVCTVASALADFASWWILNDILDDSEELLRDQLDRVHDELERCDIRSSRYYKLNEMKWKLEKSIREIAMEKAQNNLLMSFSNMGSTILFMGVCGIAWAIPGV